MVITHRTNSKSKCKHKKHGGTGLFYLDRTTNTYKKRNQKNQKKQRGGGIGSFLGSIIKSGAKKVIKKVLPVVVDLGKKTIKGVAKKTVTLGSDYVQSKLDNPHAKQIVATLSKQTHKRIDSYLRPNRKARTIVRGTRSKRKRKRQSGITGGGRIKLKSIIHSTANDMLRNPKIRKQLVKSNFVNDLVKQYEK